MPAGRKPSFNTSTTKVVQLTSVNFIAHFNRRTRFNVPSFEERQIFRSLIRGKEEPGCVRTAIRQIVFRECQRLGGEEPFKWLFIVLGSRHLASQRTCSNPSCIT